LVGCTTANPNKACSEGSCADPAFPYCDVEGTISGEPGTCISVSCQPGSIRACLGGDALTCTANGDGYEHVTCALDCVSTPEPHCAYLEPRYLPDVCSDVASTAKLDITSSGSFDPSLDSNCNGGIVEQPGAPSICVVRYADISIVSNATLTVVGSSMPKMGRSIAFVADHELRIDGALDIGAKGSVSGPGGGVVVSGGAGSSGVGAGGAGGKTNGGAGGTNTADGAGSNGGLAAADPALLAALVGGASAAKIGDSNDGGGGGGGAATLIACRGAVRVSGTISSGGGGGLNGFSLLGAPITGFGGGAGGYIVLQGILVEVAGGVFANGGGGGGGMQANTSPGQAGHDGSLSATNAAQGGYPQNGEGRGGTGGVGSTLPGGGGARTVSPASPGGGGGGVGFLQIYTPAGVEPVTTSSTTSPAFQPNATIKTR
jgi:hypothetical protein